MDFSSDYPDEEDSGLDSHMVEQLTNNIRQPATTGFPSTARNLEKKSKTIKMSSLQNVTKSVCRAQLFYRYSLTLAVVSASPRNWFVIARESLWCHFRRRHFAFLSILERIRFLLINFREGQFVQENNKKPTKLRDSAFTFDIICTV
jgi:hypothetical protein